MTWSQNRTPKLAPLDAKLIQKSLVTGGDGKTFTCVSNRLEGNGLLTILVSLGQAGTMT